MSGREKLLGRKALTINFVTSKLWQAKRGSVLKEGADQKSAVRERRSVWRTFLLKPKDIKVDKQKKRRLRRERTFALHLLLSLLRFTCFYCLGTHGRFICFALFVYSICHSKLVGWTWLVWFSWHHQSQNVRVFSKRICFPFISSQWNEMCMRAVCLVSHVNESFHSPL